MVTGERMDEAASTLAAHSQEITGMQEIWVDGSCLSPAGSIAVVGAVCENSESRQDRNIVIIHVSGTPADPPARDLTVGLVSKWERVLRRLERLSAVTIAVADGDCGGLALDVLLATDYRIASASSRLLMPLAAGATWPGMALYRLTRQAGGSAIRRAVLFGTHIEARDARAMRLVDELADDQASALAAAVEMAASFSGTELAIRRQLMLEAPDASFENALGAHLAACDRSLRLAAAQAVR